MAQNKCDCRSLSVDAVSLVASGQRCCPSAVKDYCQSLDVGEHLDLSTAFVFTEIADRTDNGSANIFSSYIQN